LLSGFLADLPIATYFYAKIAYRNMSKTAKFWALEPISADYFAGAFKIKVSSEYGPPIALAVALVET
jgi:hypothetical protein